MGLETGPLPRAAWSDNADLARKCQSRRPCKMFKVLVWTCCIWQTSAIVVRKSAPVIEATHDLTYDDSGKLVFTQLKSEKRSKASTGVREGSLYSVNVNLDVESMQASKGVTMFFDKVNHIMRLDEGIAPIDGLAWGNYVDNIEKNGWSDLWITTTANNDVSNDVRMYAAGYIEGLMTCVRLSEYHSNMHKLLIRTEATKHALTNLRSLVKQQVGFLKFKANLVPHIMAEEPKDPYWKHSRYMLFQLWGLTDWYNFAAHHFGISELKVEDMLLLNLGGELPTILDAYTPKATQDRLAAQNFEAIAFLQRRSDHTAARNMKLRRSQALRAAFKSGKEINGEDLKEALREAEGLNATEDPLDDHHWEKRVAETGHCSALIKLTEGNKDIMVGHTTWDDYSRMTRVFKYYDFPFDGAATMATKIAFSSYPGLISSTDDYYVMSSGLGVMDTSIEILNPFIWDKVQDFPGQPHIPNFVHLMITNRMAKNGAHWTRLFAKQNTGTYASQWMIVDYNRFKTGAVVPDDTFWLMEAVPGASKAADMSHFLRDNLYWPSFNRPYFDTIRECTGHTAAQRTNGAIYSWLNNPRAKIFRSAQKGISNLLEMRELMIRNLYPFTGVSPVEPGHEIDARMDLSPYMPIPNGGIDAKVVNRCLFKKMEVQAQSSPAHGAVPAFKWTRADGSEMWPSYPHNGLPNEWNFGFVQFTPLSQIAITDIFDC